VTWLAATTGDASCGQRFRVLRHREWTTGATAHSRVLAVSPKEAVVAGGRVLALAPQPHDGDSGDRDACNADWREDDPAQHIGYCQVRLTPPPRWLPGEGK
jgi:hypothetical protein